MSKKQKLVISIATIVLGVLFIILKNKVISIAMTVLGALLVIEGVIAIIKKLIANGVILIIIGALIITFGWLYATIVIYILAALLLVYGLFELILYLKAKMNAFWYVAPIIMIVIGALLLFNQKGTLEWIFIVTGVLLCIEGVFATIDALANTKEKEEQPTENKDVIDL